MTAMLKEHLRQEVPRHAPSSLHERDGNERQYYMSGANGAAREESAPRQQTYDAPPRFPEPTRPYTAFRRSQEEEHEPLPIRRNDARYPEAAPPQDPSFRSYRPSHASYNHAARSLTPQEMKMADDNARVKAMGGSLKFQPDQIGFFWPDMPRREHPDDIADISGKTYFRNVRDFLDAAKLCIAGQTMPEHIVRNNLHQCFKGTALLWYQSNLALERRIEVISGNGIERWEDKLKTFRVQPAVALARLQKEKYGPKGLLDGRSPAEWYLKVKRLCQDAGYGHESDNQYVTHAWNLLHARIRVHLQNPGTTMSSDEFLFMLEEKKHELFDVFRNDFGTSKFPNSRSYGGNGQQSGTNPAGGNHDYRDNRRTGNAQQQYQRNRNDNYTGDASNQRNQQDASANRSYPQNERNRSNGYESRNGPSHQREANYNNRSDMNNSGQSGRGPGNTSRAYGKVQGAYHNRESAAEQLGTPNADNPRCEDALDFCEQAAADRGSTPEMPTPEPFEEGESSDDSRDFDPQYWATASVHE
jgi:hypothetical protein